jgi:DNA-binding response OmpR family regulator
MSSSPSTTGTAYEPASFQTAEAQEAKNGHRPGQVENQQPRAPAPAHAHVLIADDDADVLNIMQRILRGAGYSVCTVGNGEAAWEAFCAEDFNVVITDHDMPRLSGLDLLRRLRGRQHRVPVVFISGNMPWEESDLTHLLPPGATLQKPFSGFELLASLRCVTTAATSVEHGSNVNRAEQILMEFDRD